MQQPIKVAILGIKGLPAQAGVDRVVEAIVKRFPALGVSPTVFCDRSFTPESYFLNGTTIVRVESTSGKYLSAPTRFINSAIRALFSGDFDLIHLHNIEASFILPLLRLKYPVLSTAHGFAYWRSKWGSMARMAIRLTDWPFMTFSSAITSVSEKDAKALSARYHKKVFYIPNGVGADFKPDKRGAGLLLASLGLSPKNYLIFVAGRIEPTKGAHLAIEAINRLERGIPLLVVTWNKFHYTKRSCRRKQGHESISCRL
jgi:glycosyltransferase involved in cell wall biosynthesis